MLTDDGQTDDGVTGILLAHPRALGSGELKTFGQFEKLVFVIMSTWENIRLITKTPLKLAVCLQNIKSSKLNSQILLDKLKLNQKSYYYLQNSAF